MKTFIITISLLFCMYGLTAQYREQASSSFKDRIYFGGGGGFSGGTNYVNVSVSPLVGYKITDRFSAGLQVTYQFIKYFDNKLSNYGGGPFARFNITEKFFTYTQYEYLNYGLVPVGSSEVFRGNYDSWFVGLGYSEPIGGNVAFNITALYNLLYRDELDSPYRSPFQFRVGIVAGIF